MVSSGRIFVSAAFARGRLTLDLGEIGVDEIVDFSYEVENPFHESIELMEFQGTCSCLKLESKPKTPPILKPMEKYSGKASLVMNSPGKSDQLIMVKVRSVAHPDSRGSIDVSVKSNAVRKQSEENPFVLGEIFVDDDYAKSISLESLGTNQRNQQRNPNTATQGYDLIAILAHETTFRLIPSNGGYMSTCLIRNMNGVVSEIGTDNLVTGQITA